MRIISAFVLSFSFFVGFTAHAQLYQMQANSYYLRSTPSFTSDLNNVDGVLTRNSRFQILQKVTRPDGSEAWLINVVDLAPNGQLQPAGQYWIFRGNNSDFVPVSSQLLRDTSSGICLECQQNASAPIPSNTRTSISDVSRASTRVVETAPPPSPTPRPSVTPAPPPTTTSSGPVNCAQNFSALWNRKTNGSAWTRTLCDSLNSSSLLSQNPQDIASYCPRYSSLQPAQRMQFWIYFMTVMASYETSNFNPNDTSDVEYFGADNASIGLFQMSHGDGCPGIRNNNDLRDPNKNIQCAVYKLNQLIGRDHVIAAGGGNSDSRGAARYWGPFREPRGPRISRSQLSGTQRYRYTCSGSSCVSKREEIKQTMRALPVCRTSAPQ